MDGPHFDALARRISTRRTAIGGLLAGVLLPLDAVARGKNQKRKHKRKDKKRAIAQADPCWRAGACIPKKGANVSRCDLEDYTAPPSLDCTGCNLSRANLRGADLTGVNFTKANLSGACLVNADFTGATFANSTNLSGAIFCNTKMADGEPNNSGCGSGTPCCPTCDAGQLCESGCCNGFTCGACPSGFTCGGGNPGIPGICGCTPTTCAAEGVSCGSIPDGCSGTLLCGSCGAPQACNSGACATCAATCTGTCTQCLTAIDGSTWCSKTPGAACNSPCTSNAQCGAGNFCMVSGTLRADNAVLTIAQICQGQTAVCASPSPC